MEACVCANRGCNIKSPLSDSPVPFSGEIWNKIREHNLFDNSHTICLHVWKIACTINSRYPISLSTLPHHEGVISGRKKGWRSLDKLIPLKSFQIYDKEKISSTFTRTMHKIHEDCLE